MDKWKMTIRAYNEETSLLCESHTELLDARQQVENVMAEHPEATTIHVYLLKEKDRDQDASQ